MKKITNIIKNFKNDKKGDLAVELAVLFPVILLVIAFVVNQFMYYDGITSLTTIANEASRYAAVADDETAANENVKTLLSGNDGRLASSKLGWCDGVSSCQAWNQDTGTGFELDVGAMKSGIFNNDTSTATLPNGEKTEWCNGNYVKLTIEAHKTSLLPSFEQFRKTITGKPTAWHHTYKYTVISKIENSTKCS